MMLFFKQNLKQNENYFIIILKNFICFFLINSKTLYCEKQSYQFRKESYKVNWNSCPVLFKEFDGCLGV